MILFHEDEAAAKKTASGKIKVVLPVRIGHAEVFRDLPAERLEEALCGRI